MSCFCTLLSISYFSRTFVDLHFLFHLHVLHNIPSPLPFTLPIEPFLWNSCQKGSTKHRHRTFQAHLIENLDFFCSGKGPSWGPQGPWGPTPYLDNSFLGGSNWGSKKKHAYYLRILPKQYFFLNLNYLYTVSLENFNMSH